MLRRVSFVQGSTTRRREDERAKVSSQSRREGGEGWRRECARTRVAFDLVAVARHAAAVVVEIVAGGTQSRRHVDHGDDESHQREGGHDLRHPRHRVYRLLRACVVSSLSAKFGGGRRRRAVCERVTSTRPLCPLEPKTSVHPAG